MYLPKSKYSAPKHTRGEEFLLPSGREYIGFYFITYEDRYFTGKQPGKGNLELTPIVAEDPVSATPTFTPDRSTPTATDRMYGKFTRFYLKDKRTNRIIEVEKSKYYELLEKTYIGGTKVQWILKGPAQDIVVDRYTYQGAEKKNIEEVDIQDRILPGLKDYIKDYKEFVE
jgi:hypothetical protein